jgi:outer membrane protein TolC
MDAHNPAPAFAAVGGAMLLLFTMIPFPANAQDARVPMVITLDKAVDIALRQNRDMQIAEQDRLKADAQVAEARSGAFPQINGGLHPQHQEPRPLHSAQHSHQSIAQYSNI